MEVNLSSIDQLLALFDPGRPTPILLIGAGASRRSGIPTSGELVEWVARWKFCLINHKLPEDPTVKRTDWLAWLHSHKWYDTQKKPEENYFEVIEHLLVPKSVRKEFFLWCINRDVPASVGYEHLLRLLDEGFIKTVLTTNFDHVLPDLKAACKRPHHLDIIRTPDEAVAFSGSPMYPQLVYLHGAVEYYTDQNLREEVERLKPYLLQRIPPALGDHPLIVVGYRGAEPSIMKHLLLDNRHFANKYPHGIYWCSLGGPLHPLVLELADAVKPNLQFVTIQGFDELMARIATHCDSLPKKFSVVTYRRGPKEGHLPFDMTALADAELEELDWPLIREYLRSYCQRLNIDVPQDVNDEWLKTKLCELDLAAAHRGALVPTVAGYLLFARNPEQRLKGARIEIKENGRRLRFIGGHLWAQSNALESLLEELNRPFILKTRNSEVVYPYPKIAIREICVNALVHRDYSAARNMVVEIESNCVRVINPGGLVEEVREKIHSSLQKQIEAGATGIKGYRNTVIADLFCGAGRMEKRGSGLPDVHRSVVKNGGKVFFGPNEPNTSFKAIIFRRPEEVDESTGTAAPALNSTRYASNLLEVVSLPPEVFHYALSEIDGLSSEIKDLTFPSGAGVISFAAGANFSSRASSVEEYSVSLQGRFSFTGLLNRCLFAFLRKRGLVVDEFRKRAYFPRTQDGPREVRYQASFRQATRTVTKPLVSRVSQKVLYWTHEAVWFGFERYGGQLVLRVLPGYVFTTDGTEALLYHRKVGALATRKAARDFSLQVFNHLVFWASILAGGQEDIVIPTGGEPVRIKASFSGCEVQMPVGAEMQFQPDEYQLRPDRLLQEMETEIQEDTEINSDQGTNAAKH